MIEVGASARSSSATAMRSAKVPIRSFAGAGVDLVARREAPDLRADADDGPGDVVPEDERELVREDLLELARADLLVELVQAGRPDLDEDVAVPDGGLGDVRLVQRALVLRDDERSHGVVPQC